MQVCPLLLFSTIAACTLPITGDAADPAPTSAPTTGSGSGSAAAPTATPTDYDTEILDVVANYKSAAFTKVNSQPYASAVASVGNINLYAYGDAMSYKAVHPETATTTTVGVGTVIVREVLDASGAVATLTIIAKAPAGFDSSLGDWWFGETDAKGVPTIVDGVAQVGKVTACHSCHVPREAEDYLFGVPAADQRKTN
jgi:hypothetical protein